VLAGDVGQDLWMVDHAFSLGSETGALLVFRFDICRVLGIGWASVSSSTVLRKQGAAFGVRWLGCSRMGDAG
jgi:hypothetical protein